MPPEKSLIPSNARNAARIVRCFMLGGRAMGMLFAFAVTSAIGGLAVQQLPTVPATEQNPDSGASQNSSTNANADASNKSAESREDMRADQKLQIAQQSAGLLQMAKDLKSAVEVTTSNTLSVTAFRKADAIERFVQNVKDKNRHTNHKP